MTTSDLFHDSFGLLHPGEDRKYMFSINPGRALYPVRHETFAPVEYPQIPAEIFFHGDITQFSYTIALIFTGWHVYDGVIMPTWHITVSPSNIDVADALDIVINGRSVVDELKRIANMMGGALPLIYGSCALVRVAHCGSQPAIIDAHLDFLHGVSVIRRNYLMSVASWWRWTYRPFPRGPLAPVPDLWHGVMNRRIIEDVLVGVGPEIIRRVEKVPSISKAMDTRGIDRAPESGHTIMVGGRERAMDRRAQRGGWTKGGDEEDAGIDMVAQMLEQDPALRPSGLGKASDRSAPPAPPKGVRTIEPSGVLPPASLEIIDEGDDVAVVQPPRATVPNLAFRKRGKPR